MSIFHIFLFFSVFFSFSINICFSEPTITLLPPQINTHLDEYAPSLDPFFQQLLFSSNRHIETYANHNFNLWQSAFTINKKTSVSQSIPQPINTKYYEGAASTRLDSNGNLEIYYTYSQEDFTSPNRKDTDIYVSKLIENKWQIPTPLTVINSRFHDRMPIVSHDKSRIYFSSDRPGGIGSDDIWVSHYNKKAQQWDAPQVLSTPINSIYSEISPHITQNMRQLYWSSNRPGGVGMYDLYTAYIQDPLDYKFDIWKNLLLLDINSPQNDETPYFDDERKVLIFASDRLGGFGGYDLYETTLHQKIYNKFEVYIHGNIYSHESKKPIMANLTVYDQDQNRIISLQTSPTEGFYSLLLKQDSVYKIIITAPSTLPQKILIDLSKTHLQSNIKKDIILYKKFYIPQYLHINYSIYDENKQKISAHLLNKDALKIISRQDFFHDLKKSRISFKISKDLNSREYFIDFLQQSSFTIELKYSNHEKFQNTYLFSSLFSEPYNSDNKDLEVYLQNENESTLNSVSFEESTLLGILYFPIGTYNTYSTPEKLKQIADQINLINNTSKKTLILVHGHTDDIGDFQVNQRLSKNRSIFIKNKLIDLGVSSNLVKTYWYANSKPQIQTKNKRVPQNRRVEILLIKDQITQ